MTRRFISLSLALLLIFTFLPASIFAYADNADSSAGSTTDAPANAAGTAKPSSDSGTSADENAPSGAPTDGGNAGGTEGNTGGNGPNDSDSEGDNSTNPDNPANNPSGTEDGNPSANDEITGAEDGDGSTTPEDKLNAPNVQAEPQDDEPKLDTQAAAPLATPLAKGRYILRSALSYTKVLDVASASKKSGAHTQLYVSNMTNAQKFDITYDAQGYYTIKNLNSEMVLGVAGGKVKNNAQVVQYKASSDSLALKWVVSKASGSKYRFTSALHKNLILTVYGGKDVDGSKMVVSKANNTNSQAFIPMLENPTVSSNIKINDGLYMIASSLDANMVIDVPSASYNNGVQMQLYTKNNTIAQMFEFKLRGDGFYTIRTLNNGRYLTVQDGNLVGGAAIVQMPSTGGNEQRWAIERNADKTYSFVSKKSGLRIDCSPRTAQLGNKVQTWYASSLGSQKFTLKGVSTDPKINGVMTLTPYAKRNNVVDIANGSRGYKANARAYVGNGTLAQKFEIKRVSGQTYSIQNLNSGRYLADVGGDVLQGALPKTKLSSAQQWTATRTFGGFTLTNVASGRMMTLAAVNGSYDIVTSPANRKSSQVFNVQSTPVLPMDTYRIVTKGGMLVESADAKINNGTNTRILVNTKNPCQIWKFTPVGSGKYFEIACVRSSRVLTVNKSNVRLWDDTNSSTQRWRALPSGDGYFYLQNHLGKYMATPGNGEDNGLNIGVTASIAKAKKFRFAQTSYSGFSGTYVDVNISTQKLMFIKNGVLLLECDVVTGRPGMNTPTGTYYILYKQSPAVLVGADYRSPVSYWMPFTNAGHGFHDANWQSSFGGNRWRNGYGSHGCVNMPTWAAKTLYQNMASGTTVKIHW